MDLFSYLQNGKTAYHSVAETASMLSGAAFNALNEHDVWDLKAGDGFFVQRNSSSLFVPILLMWMRQVLMQATRICTKRTRKSISHFEIQAQEY